MRLRTAVCFHVCMQMPSLPPNMKPISTMDVCRLANRNKQLNITETIGFHTTRLPTTHDTTNPPNAAPMQAATGPSFAIHEDTDFFPPLRTASSAIAAAMPQPAAAAAPLAFAIHEDTDILALPPPAAAAIGGNGRRRRRSSSVYPGLGEGYGGVGVGGAGGGVGLCVYEDTVCVGVPPLGAQQGDTVRALSAAAAPMGGGLQVYEDTICVQQAPTQSQPARAVLGSLQQQTQTQLATAAAPGLQIYEDTICVQQGPPRAPLRVQPAAAAAPPPGAGLNIYEDTELLATRRLAPRTDALIATSAQPLQIYEDTVCVRGGLSQGSASGLGQHQQQPPQGSQRGMIVGGGVSIGQGGMCIHEDTEFGLEGEW